MIKLASIQIKALILLSVFSLNTMISFACSMGLDMRFDCHDHEEGSGTLDEHFHSDKKTHLHIIDFSYDADKLHHHDNESNEDKDDCCCDEITKFNLLDKTHTSFAQFDAIFFNAFI